MPSSRPHSRGLRGGTRNPVGAPAAAHPPTSAAKQYSQCWPGWCDDPNGLCSCTWAFKDGIRQVKFSNAGCLVRHRERVP